MSEHSRNASSQPGPLSVLLASYLEALDRGTAPDPREFVAQHPQFARELEAFFADQNQVKRLAQASKVRSPDSKATGDKQQTADQSTPPAGAQVHYFGDYEIHEEIGRGGMGVVYRARQVSLDRQVALKLILAGQLADRRAVARFRREARAAAKVDHPRIVPIYEVGEH
ncbi:MAG TPA: hypothetical protein VFA18_11240, partial [Gemmataceae bacterium]|nr:hypothetical protein [Gemmataceae bacterium]